MSAELNFDDGWQNRILRIWDELAQDKTGPFRSTLAGYRVSSIGGSRHFFKGIHLLRTDRKRKTKHEGNRERATCECLTQRPFAVEDFNFTHVRDDEIIGKFPASGFRPYPRSGTFGVGAHALLVNVSPLAYGHCLLCPDHKACRPQVLSLDALKLAVAFARASDADRGDMKVMFNSLGAWASVNHLHFHVFWPSGRQDLDSSTGLTPLQYHSTQQSVFWTLEGA
ncbi:conserved hypothetical protein [Perkinsus marinus ATCC 50983]|uniref:GDPGP1-like N-terminal domain-containing protein n=1 Tax=Perkinsus marinus (strain ATCC 50983 / TXsc) TaxID=423536 RepID=C5KHF7_PERM5|nr:conserved hypothetical protein [Perkinsus marinus ATCC 50983]EER16019.1 conserved hypothetical protein [Perkinsus marinus ATCC 50983]|eukprot:XP_002784223.1 conserved hypothetical protein [Perkinsus marinus ATCC 50983]